MGQAKECELQGEKYIRKETSTEYVDLLEEHRGFVIPPSLRNVWKRANRFPVVVIMVTHRTGSQYLRCFLHWHKPVGRCMRADIFHQI